MKVITNGHPRDLIDASQLTLEEQKEFDYLDWPKLERGEDSAEFFRYRGELYDLGNFMRGDPTEGHANLPASKKGWDGYMGDSFYSGTVVKFVNDFEQVIVGVLIA